MKKKKKHPLYEVWIGIKQRCYNQKSRSYLGGKIKVCEEWEKDFQSFYTWTIKYWEKGLSLSRKDEGGNYSPKNCYFRSQKEIAIENFKKASLLNIGRGKSQKTIKKTQKTNLKKYGVKNPMQCKEVKEKVKKTNLEKYGVECSLHFGATKEKTKKTNLERYGVENVFQADDIKQKIKKNNLKKYGVECTLQVKEVKEKIKQTNLKKYGVEYASQSSQFQETVKQTRIKKGTIFIKDGKTIKEWAKEKGWSYDGIRQKIQKYGVDLAFSNFDKKESGLETAIKSLLIKNNIEFEQWKNINNKFPDFFLSGYNLIIEGDGLFYHCDYHIKDKNYHKNKQQLYKNNGYSSLFFREDEIENKLEIVESIILNKIGRTKTKIFARKCEVISLYNNERKEFFEQNHLMGKGSGKCFGLKFQNEIVSAMQFIVRKNYTDISRFCNKLNTTVIGGFSKLVKQIEMAVKPSRICTFVDLRYGSGEYLEGLGFFKEAQHLSFRWTRGGVSVHRMKFRGNSGYEEGWYKIWDCGQAKYVKNIS